MNDETILLPCPFCGGEAKVIQADHPSYTPHSEGWYVICKCGATLGYHGTDELYMTYGDFATEYWAIKAWNTRVAHGTLTAEQVKRIHEIIEKHWHDLPAEYDMPEATALPEYSYDWQAIADELNAAWNSRAAMEFDNWFYLPKPKERIVVYSDPEITRTENGYKVRNSAYVVNEAARKWGEELGEYAMQRICEIWNSRAERTCKLVETDRYTNSRETIHVLECSECGETCEHVNGIYPRCPHCGARVVE